MVRAVTQKSAYRYVCNVCLLHFFTLRLVLCLPLHHPPSFPIPARTQALLVPLSCQLPLSSHLLLWCMVHQTIEPPPPPLLDNDKINILSQIAYANEDIRAPALPAALITSEAQSVPCVRGPAPLVLCLGPFLLSPLRVPPFPLTRLMVFYPHRVPPPNKTGSDKTLQDRIRQDPHNAKQDPLQSDPPPLLLPTDSPTPTPSNLYL